MSPGALFKAVVGPCLTEPEPSCLMVVSWARGYPPLFEDQLATVSAESSWMLGTDVKVDPAERAEFL